MITPNNNIYNQLQPTFSDNKIQLQSLNPMLTPQNDTHYNINNFQYIQPQLLQNLKLQQQLNFLKTYQLQQQEQTIQSQSNYFNSLLLFNNQIQQSLQNNQNQLSYNQANKYFVNPQLIQNGEFQHGQQQNSINLQQFNQQNQNKFLQNNSNNGLNQVDYINTFQKYYLSPQIQQQISNQKMNLELSKKSSINLIQSPQISTPLQKSIKKSSKNSFSMNKLGLLPLKKNSFQSQESSSNQTINKIFQSNQQCLKQSNKSSKKRVSNKSSKGKISRLEETRAERWTFMSKYYNKAVLVNRFYIDLEDEDYNYQPIQNFDIVVKKETNESSTQIESASQL